MIRYPVVLPRWIASIAGCACLVANVNCDKKPVPPAQSAGAPHSEPQNASVSVSPDKSTQAPDSRRLAAGSVKPDHMLDRPVVSGRDSRIPGNGLDSMKGLPFLEAISEKAFVGFRDASNNEELQNVFLQLTRGQRILNVIADVEQEVNNGGLSQYYSNSSGAFAPEAGPAMRAIGMTHFAEIVEEANALFPSGLPPRDRAARQAALEKVDKRAFDALDDRFFKAYREEEEISKAMEKYVWDHPDEFFTK